MDGLTGPVDKKRDQKIGVTLLGESVTPSGERCLAPTIDPVTFAIKVPVDTMTLTIQPVIDPVTLAIQMTGGGFMTVGFGNGSFTIETVVDDVAFAVETILDSIALAIEMFVDGITRLRVGRHSGQQAREGDDGDELE